MPTEPSIFTTLIVPVAASCLAALSAIIAALLVYKGTRVSTEESRFTALQDRLVSAMETDLNGLRQNMADMKRELVTAEEAEDRWRKLARESEDRDRECRRKLAALEEKERRHDAVIEALRHRIEELELA